MVPMQDILRSAMQWKSKARIDITQLLEKQTNVNYHYRDTPSLMTYNSDFVHYVKCNASCRLFSIAVSNLNE